MGVKYYLKLFNDSGVLSKKSANRCCCSGSIYRVRGA